MPPQFRAVAQVLFLTDLGLYIHTPFCAQKCKYCDFYSFPVTPDFIDSYTKRVTEEITKWGVRTARPIDSLYLGGGTPSLLGGENIEKIIYAARNAFPFDSPEITLECNPADDLTETLKAAAKAGVNRLSIGVQSALDNELSMLGRRHTARDAVKTVAAAKNAGIDNISLDLMIGLPESSCASVEKSVDFVCSLEPRHISVYILKLEEGTPLFESHPPMPDDDEISDQYLFTVQRLKENGYRQYEISNFAQDGYESRHNLKYWNLEEYLGIGPSAHSFLDGRRFFYPRDIKAFLDGCSVIPDGSGGDSEEYIMLRLRLFEGIILEDYEKRYGSFPKSLKDKALSLQKAGFMKVFDKGIRLTEKGFLVSNAVIGEFI